MRSVAINRGVARQRQAERLAPADAASDTPDDGRDPLERAEQAEAIARLRRMIGTRLHPLEARVLYLHYVDGMSLPAITRLLGLSNRSGAKAYVVSGKRKLRRPSVTDGRDGQPIWGIAR